MLCFIQNDSPRMVPTMFFPFSETTFPIMKILTKSKQNQNSKK